MSRARLNIFVEPEHAKRLEDFAVHRGVSKSSVIAAALASFLSPDAMDQAKPPWPGAWTGSHASSSDWSATSPS